METTLEAVPPARADARQTSQTEALSVRAGIPLLLAAIAFLVYLPSLESGFVYDTRVEILQEGFITSISNLWDVLTLKVLGMNLMLASRPGELLYLMLIAAVCGKAPFGYHLCNNLLHAANVALIFILLRRLMKADAPEPANRTGLNILLASAVSLLFAVHPMNVESVAEVSYCSSLLVTFFTLLALLAATAFRAEDFRSAMILGGAGVFCAFAAVACKESGAAVAPLLMVYWWLFRRRERKFPWIVFLSVALAVTVAFLAARFLLAVTVVGGGTQLKFSLAGLLLIQPRFWALMIMHFFLPIHLSADYTLGNIRRVSLPIAVMVLAVTIYLQAWLSVRNRIGALGVAIYWLGLATVSNFIPLLHAEADRYYYLPLAGAAMQLLAAVLLWKSFPGWKWAAAIFFCALLPLALLAVARESVFADEYSLWSDTIKASPDSVRAYNGLGVILYQQGELDEAVAEYQTALKINSNDDQLHNNLGAALLAKGEPQEAVVQFQKAADLNRDSAQNSYNLGLALFQVGRTDEAIAQYRRTLEMNPMLEEVYGDLGVALAREGRLDEAIAQFQEALRLNPGDGSARHNLDAVQAARPAQGPR